MRALVEDVVPQIKYQQYFCWSQPGDSLLKKKELLVSARTGKTAVDKLEGGLSLVQPGRKCLRIVDPQSECEAVAQDHHIRFRRGGGRKGNARAGSVDMVLGRKVVVLVQTGRAGIQTPAKDGIRPKNGGVELIAVLDDRMTPAQKEFTGKQACHTGEQHRDRNECAPAGWRKRGQRGYPKWR